MMRIAIEAIGIDKPGGGRTSILNLLLSLFSLDTDSEYRVYLSKPEESLNEFSNVEQVIVPEKNRFAARLWAQQKIPSQVRQFDLIHFTKNLTLFGLQIPYIVTIHDLTTLKLRKFFPLTDVLYWQTIERLSVQGAQKVIAVSQNTCDDLVRIYRISPEKIRVIYHGVSSRFYPRVEADIRKVREKYSLFDNYLITVGRIDTKKNLTTLVRVFNALKKNGTFSGKLVLVGEVYKKCEDFELVPTIHHLGLDRDVIFLGSVPDEDLPSLYSGAILCPFPSIHEGFGLVGLEAMACGVPVITHNSSGITEVMGEAGLMVDATDEKALYTSMEAVINQPLLRDRMRTMGLEQSAKFRWNLSAEMTYQVYRESIRK